LFHFNYEIGVFFHAMILFHLKNKIKSDGLAALKLLHKTLAESEDWAS